jgi:hypothetical protein
VLFLIGVFSDLHQDDFICWGLLVATLALIVEDLGLGTSVNMGGPRRDTTTP